MNNSSNASGGMGFFSTLTLIFIVLKLTNVIAWSWWIVLLPFWGPLALLIPILLLAAIVGAL